MGAGPRVERIREGAFERLEIVVEIDVRDVVFLEEFDIIIRQRKIQNAVLEGLGHIFGIDYRLGGTEHKQELCAVLPQSVDKCQSFLNVLLGISFGVLNGPIFRPKQFASDVIKAGFQVKFVVFAFVYILVGDFPETRIGDLVVATAEELPKPCLLPGEIGEVFLIRAVKVGFEGQFLFLDLDIARVWA